MLRNYFNRMCMSVAFCAAMNQFSSASAPESQQPQKIREAYLRTISNLEAITSTQMHVKFEFKVTPKGDVKNEYNLKNQHLIIDYYAKDKKKRIDVVDMSDNNNIKTNVYVINGEKSFEVYKSAEDDPYAIASIGGDERMLRKGTSLAAGFIEAAYRITQYIDMREIMLNNKNYQISLLDNNIDSVDSALDAVTSSRVVPSPNDVTGTDGDTCELHVRRVSSSSSDSKGLHFVSGDFVLLPEYDWSIKSFNVKMSAGNMLEGVVEYLDVEGLRQRSLPSAIHLVSSQTNSPIESIYNLNRISVNLDTINDRIFTLDEFGLGPKGVNKAYILITVGIAALVLAILIRSRNARSEPPPPFSGSGGGPTDDRV